jgi:TRAP-type uncharacterized transport system substrate-binding protein
MLEETKDADGTPKSIRHPFGRTKAMKLIRIAAAALAVSALLAPALAPAQTRITYKSAKTGSSYYQMAVQLSEAVKRGSDGALILTVEESQGSVQNVMEVAARSGNYVFTTPPALVGLAQAEKAMFEGKGNPRFAEIRALFPIPSLTMHFVVDADAGVSDLAGLAGKTILLGKGSFGATEGEKYLELFGLAGKVTVADVELSNAVAALKNGQIDGIVVDLPTAFYLVAVEVLSSDGAFRMGGARRLFQFHGATADYWGYDVSADDQRFLITAPLDEDLASPVTVMTDWTRRVSER